MDCWLSKMWPLILCFDTGRSKSCRKPFFYLFTENTLAIRQFSTSDNISGPLLIVFVGSTAITSVSKNIDLQILRRRQKDEIFLMLSIVRV